MNVEIVTLDNRHVMGSVIRINPMAADYITIWREGFDPHEPVVAEMALEPGYYGVYYGSEEEGRVDLWPVATRVGICRGSDPSGARILCARHG